MVQRSRRRSLSVFTYMMTPAAAAAEEEAAAAAAAATKKQKFCVRLLLLSYKWSDNNNVPRISRGRVLSLAPRRRPQKNTRTRMCRGRRSLLPIKYVPSASCRRSIP
ncbi:unnamed protein product, partial [Ectocarpus sp. 8 AP-2014]